MQSTVEYDQSIQLWEKQLGESDRAWAAFQIYRDLAAKRTYQAVADQLQCSHTNVRAWASRWDWRVRADAFDRHVDDEARKKQIRDRVEMRARHAKFGAAMTFVGAHALKELQDKIEQKLPLKLSTAEISQLMSEGTRIERAALGEDSEQAYTKINVIVQRTIPDDPEDVQPEDEQKALPPTIDGDTGDKIQ